MRETGSNRGLSFPFFLALVLFLAVVADGWLGDPFVPSAAYRAQTLWHFGVVAAAALLWLWILTAARRRAARFDGPIETVRGRNGVLQPILGTIFLVVVANLGWQQALPKLINVVTAEHVTSAVFSPSADIARSPTGCHRLEATSQEFGAVRLCLPERVAERLRDAPGSALTISGSSSWFGLQAERYEIGLQSSTTTRADPAKGPGLIGHRTAKP